MLHRRTCSRWDSLFALVVLFLSFVSKPEQQQKNLNKNISTSLIAVFKSCFFWVSTNSCVISLLFTASCSRK